MSGLALGLANVFGVLVVLLALSALLTWIERRLLGFWQDRYGPNRVGFAGTLQIVADMIKILFKQDWVPPFSQRGLFGGAQARYTTKRRQKVVNSRPDMRDRAKGRSHRTPWIFQATCRGAAKTPPCAGRIRSS